MNPKIKGFNPQPCQKLLKQIIKASHSADSVSQESIITMYGSKHFLQLLIWELFQG